MADAALLNVVLYLPLAGIAALVALPARQDESRAAAVARRDARCSSP